MQHNIQIKRVINWYPPVPAKLESIEGKLLDKVKASK
jgi:spermidine/putrescine transport system substrate-binding protein